MDIAKNLVLHHAFAFTGPNNEIIYTAFRPFLYPAFIALFWTGEGPPHKLIVAIQIAMGSLTVVLTYLIARKHFSRLAAIVPAVLLMLSPMGIRFSAAILTESLFTFLIVAACYFWDNNHYKSAGAMFGLALLTRPIVASFLILLPFFSLLPIFRNMRRSLLIITLLAFFVASFWIVRNSLLLGHPTLTQSSGYGTNLLYGTIDTPMYGDDIWTWVTQLPLTQDVEGLNESQQDRRKLMLAVSLIAEHPADWIKARAKQYPKLFLDSGDSILRDRSRPIGEALRDSDFLVVGVKIGSTAACAILLFLFAVGIIGFIRKYPQSLNVYGLPVFFMLIHLPMWIESRYLLPVMPFIYIVATYGAQTCRRFVGNNL